MVQLRRLGILVVGSSLGILLAVQSAQMSPSQVQSSVGAFLGRWGTPVQATTRAAHFEEDSRVWDMAFAHRGGQIRVYLRDGTGEVAQVGADGLKDALAGKSLGKALAFASLAEASILALSRLKSQYPGQSLEIVSAQQPPAAWPAPKGTMARCVDVSIRPRVQGYLVYARSAGMDLDTETGELLSYYAKLSPLATDPPPGQVKTLAECQAALGAKYGATFGAPNIQFVGWFEVEKNRGRVCGSSTTGRRSTGWTRPMGGFGDGRSSRRRPRRPDGPNWRAWSRRSGQIARARGLAWRKLLANGFRPAKRLPSR